MYIHFKVHVVRIRGNNFKKIVIYTECISTNIKEKTIRLRIN